ncbi:uncharacterized protein LOC124359042 isoform X3 [Homalodisca vitripennis]|uniref:uncharacterized protein LOC124359042 isoform X3 n=1 Tax=Homalodisca vitripennis TaxID=197043 RepID=UPI001EEC68AC|nr:uncharacterized protein LOC124359042 isoform X3 [Homalodisca vitripennis]
MDVDSNRAFCDSGIVEDRSLDYSSGPDSTSPTSLCFTPVKWSREMYATRIPIATWRLAELEFFSTRIPIAKWRLREFYMEKKNKMYRGTATSFGFKKPVISATNNANSNAPLHHTPVPAAPEKLSDSVESLVITPTAARYGTPRLARPRKDTNGTNGRTNRFGFRSPTALSNKVADSQNNINSTKANLRLDGLVSQHPAEEGAKQTSQLPLPRSHLPRLQQFPVRLATPANYHPRTASAEKSAKTAANHHTARRSRSENGGSSASSVNDADSGVGSQKSGGEAEIIEQLECSPSARNRLRASHKSRPMEMIFPNGHEKKFELRDLRDSIEVTEIMSLELPPLPLAKRLPVSGGLVRERARAYNRQISRDSGSSEDDEGIEDGPGEEKVHRDRVLSEKDEKGVLGAGEEGAEGEGEDLWGHGEAMVGEEDMPCSQDLDSDQGCRAMTPPLRSVLLSIEDHSFAALAAMSTSTMLEDESYPELPDFQNSLSLTCTSTVTSPNSVQSQPAEKKNSEDSPGSPGTPTHTSNSLSFSSDIRDRDFIDDEICDQPGLVCDNLTANSSGNTLVPDDASPRINKPLNAIVTLTVDCGSARHSSVGTLSPCESIASDDLIMDFDLSAVDDDHRYFYRLDTSSLDLALTDGEAEGEEGGDLTLQERSTLLSARPELMNGVRATRQLRPRVGSSGSGADSPRSLDTPRLRSGSALSSPLRSSRQGTSSPGEDISEDSGIRVNRGTYQSMYQDVINIKALLLRLSRVMQENEAENSHENSQKNGFYNPNCDSAADRKNEIAQQEVIADLQRQVVFLQSQVEEKERTIRTLQATQPPEPRGQVETCNAATQTERVRPLSTGPILSTQPDASGGSFVSNTSDVARPQPNTRPVSRLPQWRRAASPSTELHKSLPTQKQT